MAGTDMKAPVASPRITKRSNIVSDLTKSYTVVRNHLIERKRNAYVLLYSVSPNIGKYCEESLKSFNTSHREVLLTDTPRGHYCKEQCRLVSLEFCKKITRRTITYLDIRESFENLVALKDFIGLTEAGKLSSLIRRLMLIMSDLASSLEHISQAAVTNWTMVAEMFAGGTDTSESETLHLVPKLSYFTTEKLLGAGGFGSAYKATIGEAVVTVKYVPAEKMETPKVACVDKVVGSMLNHPFIVCYYSCFSAKGVFVSVMEYIHGSDLQKVLKEAKFFSTEACRLAIAQLCLAVEHMHNKGFIHRDIKPSNVLIKPGLILKLIDFDTVKICGGNFATQKLKTFYRRTISEFKDGEAAGTEAYFPPEIIRRSAYGRSVDWWAVGVTLFQLALGRLPFDHNLRQVMKDRIISVSYKWPESMEIDGDLRDMVEKILKKRIADRLCSVHYREFYDHPFMSPVNWKALQTSKFILDFAPILACMRKDSQTGTSPTKGVPQAEYEDESFQHPLYVHASAGFKNVLKSLRSGNIPSSEDILDPPELPSKNTITYYKFIDFAHLNLQHTYLDLHINRTKGVLFYEVFGFRVCQTKNELGNMSIIVDQVIEGSPAYCHGLHFGDQILRINDVDVTTISYEVFSKMVLNATDQLLLRVNLLSSFRLVESRRDLPTLFSACTSRTVTLPVVEKKKNGCARFGLSIGEFKSRWQMSGKGYFLVTKVWGHSYTEFDECIYFGDVITHVDGLPIADVGVENAFESKESCTVQICPISCLRRLNEQLVVTWFSEVSQKNVLEIEVEATLRRNMWRSNTDTQKIGVNTFLAP